MNRKNKLITTIVSVIILALGLFTVPALAHDNGSSDDNSGSSSESSDTSKTSDDHSQQEQENEIENEANHQAKKDLEDSLDGDSNKVLHELGMTNHEHSNSEREKNCQSAEHGLETKLQNLSKNATKFQTRIDTALDLAIAYQKDNNISVDNFDQLVATAQAAKSTSAASVSALNDLNTNLDCSSQSVAQNVAKFKVAAKQARTDLKAYKEAVKAILRALEVAKEGN